MERGEVPGERKEGKCHLEKKNAIYRRTDSGRLHCNVVRYCPSAFGQAFFSCTLTAVPFCV